MTTDFDDLVQITALLEEQAMARFRDVLAEENQLLQELAEIDALRQTVLADSDAAHARRISGMETQWQSWLVQRRTAINQQVLILQVRKTERQTAARQAHAKLTVAENLSDDARQQTAQAVRSAEEDRLRSLTLLRVTSKDR